RRQIIAEMGLREQIGKKGRQSNARRTRLLDETCVRSLETQTECRTVGASVDVSSVEGKDQGLVTEVRERSNQCLADMDFKRLYWTAIARPRAYRTHGSRSLRGERSVEPLKSLVSPTSWCGGSSWAPGVSSSLSAYSGCLPASPPARCSAST